MTYSEAFSLFLSEIRKEARLQGIYLHASAINFASDVFKKAVQSKGIPNAATIEEIAKRWVARLCTSQF